MSSYIDADALLFELSGKDPNTHIPSYMLEYCVLMCKILEDYPKSEVAPVVHAQWKQVSKKSPKYVCTNCNHLFNNRSYKFCPHCGAKMDEKEKEA